IGMKLVVSWSPQGVGAALAYLVGMLALGTALPHGVRFLGAKWNWQTVIMTSSGLAIAGGLLILLLGDGPHLALRSRLQGLNVRRILCAFRSEQLRAPALGYFGHMWELYTFWTLVPVMIGRSSVGLRGLSVPGLAFVVIAIGAVGCIAGGRLSRKHGSA